MGREAQINASNSFIRRIAVIRHKWRLSAEKFIGQHADTPVIDVRVVLLSVDHLGRQVVESAAHRVATIVRRMGRPPEIRYLGFELEVRETRCPTSWPRRMFSGLMSR